MDDTRPHVAIVTGAGSGVGRSTAQGLARAGYDLVLVGRTQSKLEATADTLPTGTAVICLPTDITDPDAPRQIINATLDRFDRIDGLVNVAGLAPLQPIPQITPAIWRDNIDVNLSAPVLLTAAVWPTFERQRSGTIVNVSSMSSVDPFPGFSIYGAAKVGLNLFTRCTADEGKAIGVRAVAVAPGAVETPMLRQNFDETMLPPQRTLSPDAVAEVICDCITGRRAFEPGETIFVPSP